MKQQKSYLVKRRMNTDRVKFPSSTGGLAESLVRGEHFRSRPWLMLSERNGPSPVGST